MNRPIIGTALPIAGIILIAWSAILGSPNETVIEWGYRTIITYPLCHIAVRKYRHREQRQLTRHEKN
jgi:hypothetical protein